MFSNAINDIHQSKPADSVNKIEVTTVTKFIWEPVLEEQEFMLHT